MPKRITASIRTRMRRESQEAIPRVKEAMGRVRSRAKGRKLIARERRKKRTARMAEQAIRARKVGERMKVLPRIRRK